MPQVPCQAAPIARTLCRRLCVVAVAALSLVPVRAAAQPAPRPGSGILRTVGVEAAVTAATLSGGGTETAWTPGFLAGVFFSPKPDAVTWQIEGLLHRKGSRIGSGTIRTMYVELPLLLRVNLRPERANRFHLLAGLSIGVRVRASLDAGGETLELPEFGSRVEYSAAVGAGVDLNRITVELRVIQGLNPTSLVVGGEDTRNRILALLFGFRLGGLSP